MANAGGGFKLEYFAKLYKLEAAHFWFRARNALIIWMLKKYSPNFQSFLEIGCGTGYVLSGVATSFPKAKISGSEIFSEGLTFAASRVKDAQFMQMDGAHIPFVDEFDVVGAFDVIEHIPEDEAVLAGIYKAVKPGGYVLLTVPQHPLLWSGADDYWCHVRRYTVTEIHKKVECAGFKIVRTTSFVSLLLPGMLALRMSGRNKSNFDGFDELRNNLIVNRLMEIVLGLERLLIQAGLSFPVGGSRLVLARKGSAE
ncbi:MAG: class I SAM-dependent methyltransferase [Sulfuricurvum sp.]|nr:class I SAM-dependent methyltransferase [Sulfuricurvum sp.]